MFHEFICIIHVAWIKPAENDANALAQIYHDYIILSWDSFCSFKVKYNLNRELLFKKRL